MPKTIQLSVAEPCHENWDNMTPDQKGRFCGSCRKQVVDFTYMSDRELVQFFKKPSTGSVCGRFMNDQLERDILIPERRVPWVRYMMQILLPVFFVSKADAQKTMGKLAARPFRDTSKIKVVPDNRVLGMVARGVGIRPVCSDQLIPVIGDTIINKSVQVRGRVFGEQGEPLAHASIRMIQNGLLVVADSMGRFIINTMSDGPRQDIEISAAGYQTKKSMIDPEKYKKEEYIVLLTAHPALPEVVLPVSYGTVKGRYVVGGAVSVKKEQLEVKPIPQLPVANNSLQVYPNPVAAGASLHISFDKLKDGYYQLAIYSISGQLIQQKEIWLDADAKVLSLDVPVLAQGNYLLIFMHKETGERQTAKFLVQ